MKNIYFLVTVLVAAAGFGQDKTFSGTVKDITTQMPVELVSISVENSNIGAVTNEEGSFRITLPSGEKLQFSHLNYNVYTFSPGDEGDLEIFLEPKSYTLDEIIVSTVPVDKMMKGIIKNSKKKLEKSILMNAYYREFGRVNGQYTSFADGMVDYHIKKQNGKADVYVKQSRAKKIKDAVLRKKSMDLAGLSFFDIEDAVSDAYNFKMVTKLLNSDSYEYMLRNRTDANGNTIQVVTITPKDGVKEHLYEGSITYDLQSNLILEIDLRKADSHEKYMREINILIARAKLLSHSRKSVFKLTNGKYMLGYNQNRLGMHIKMKNNLDDSFESMCDIVNLDYKEGEFDFDRDTRFQEKSLYKAGTHFTDEFWKTRNIMLLSNEEENVLRAFENETASVTP